MYNSRVQGKLKQDKKIYLYTQYWMLMRRRLILFLKCVKLKNKITNAQIFPVSFN